MRYCPGVLRLPGLLLTAPLWVPTWVGTALALKILGATT